MKVSLFFDHEWTSWIVIPTLVLTLGECECCGGLGGVSIQLGWLCFQTGVIIEQARH